MNVGEKVTITDTHWRGMRAISLEGGGLRAVFVPDVGAKMVSLFDAAHDYEWLIDSGERPLRPIQYGATFVEQDMSGWDEMIPTIESCPFPGAGQYAGVPLPDHGEVWSLPWEASRETPRIARPAAAATSPPDADGILFTVQGKALPYQLSRLVTLSAPGELRFEYRLTNLGLHPMPYLWAAQRRIGPANYGGLSARSTLGLKRPISQEKRGISIALAPHRRVIVGSSIYRRSSVWIKQASGAKARDESSPCHGVLL